MSNKQGQSAGVCGPTDNKGEVSEKEGNVKEEAENLYKEDKSAVADVLTSYLSQVGMDDLLTIEEEVELGKKISQGDKKAMHELVKANLRLVIFLAKKYTGKGLLLIDLISEGNLGLMVAAKKYDYRKGYRFSTYATWWINQYLSRAIANKSRTIRIPVYLCEVVSKVNQTYRTMTMANGRPPTIKEMSKELNLSEKKVSNALLTNIDTVSLDMQVGEDGHNTLGDIVIDEVNPTPDKAYSDKVMKKTVSSILSHLDERERKIVELRFGLLDGETKTLEEVGAEFNLSRERVRQVEARALSKLRQPHIINQIDGFLDEAYAY